MSATSTAAATFQKLRALHAVLGDTVPCPWAAYRAEMTGLYGIDGPTLDAFARLGHFHVSPNAVRFAGGL